MSDKPLELRFTPNAWAKILYFRDAGNTEIAGLGVTHSDDPLLVTAFHTVEQEASHAFVEMDGDALGAYLEAMDEADIPPNRCFRIWIHTHPGDSATPSGTDEKTFQEAFGRCDWAVMFILAKGGQTYCRLRYTAQTPFGAIQQVDEISARIAWESDFAGVTAEEQAQWKKDYDAHILPRVTTITSSQRQTAWYHQGDDPTGWGIQTYQGYRDGHAYFASEGYVPFHQLTDAQVKLLDSQEKAGYGKWLAQKADKKAKPRKAKKKGSQQLALPPGDDAADEGPPALAAGALVHHDNQTLGRMSVHELLNCYEEALAYGAHAYAQRVEDVLADHPEMV